MKGFYIHIKNDLLDVKHYESMGASVWLYLWLLDKVTSVNEKGVGKVLGGKPIVYSELEKEIGIPRSAYVRYVNILRDAGYIDTLRTPNGLVITVNKTKKVFGQNDKKEPKSDVAKQNISPIVMLPSATAMLPSATCNIRQDKDKTSITTKVVIDETSKYGKPELNKMFDFWTNNVGYEISSKRQANRNACNNLLKKYGNDKFEQLIKGVALAQADRYAPSIADFCDLQAKLNQLIKWGRSKQQLTEVVEL